MSNSPGNRPRIYADFNKWDGDGVSRHLILTCSGTLKDLAKLGIGLSEGLEVVFYMDDADSKGNSDDLEVDARVHFDGINNHWVGVVDWNVLRHASDRLGK